MTDTNPEQTRVTEILQRAGNSEAVLRELLPIVYEELRNIARAQMAKETPGQTLQPTALVHEAYLRLFQGVEPTWENRAHFFGAAARSMRQILINRAKSRKAEKHGGKMTRQEFNEGIFSKEPEPDWLLTLDSALEKLEKIDRRKVQVVMMRYFAGLNINDSASALGISSATVTREWKFAKAWLHREMTRGTD
ncbi:MAG TPA: RNA polymerase subunit sigma [Planctomycetaceae bacterium]|nr:RNA polymerase subunit sigma [Planctomycetaceae bacterium]